MKQTYIILTILTLAMISALIYAFTSSGSPLETRGRKFDQTRESNLSSLKYSIDNYYYKNYALPEKLDDVFTDPNNSFYKNDSKDPETGDEYEYRTTGTTTYQLCATFSTKSKTADSNNSVYTTPIGGQSFEHPKGHKCFDLQITTTNNVFNNPSTYNFTATQDSQRIADLTNLNQAITNAVKTASGSARAKILCSGNTGTNTKCGGNSQYDLATSDGLGWVKANLKDTKGTYSYGFLPKDPINDTLAHYVYCSDGTDWEIDASLESQQYKPQMTTDGGDEQNRYEVGSKLTLIGPTGICSFSSTTGLTNSL